MSACEVVDFFLLKCDFFLTSFKENCEKAHFIWVEFHDFSDEKFLYFVKELLLFIFRFSFQCHPKFKLVIVD